MLQKMIEIEGKVFGVKMLSRGAQECMGRTIQTVGRSLEAVIYRWEFLDGDEEDVLKELAQFQNPDGGFGHGLESDFQLPDSSPMATSVGLRILLLLPDGERRTDMMDRAFLYLEEAYDSDRGGWYIVPANVVDYPHAPWWGILEETGHTAMDASWGNPSAEILAQFLIAERNPESFDLHKQVLHAIHLLETKTHFKSEHELYCYLALYDALKGDLQTRLGETLAKGVQAVLVLDEEKWEEYVPMPLHFVHPSRKQDFGIRDEDVNRQLDWLAVKMEKCGGWSPPWGESFYQEGLKKSYHEWIGVLTLKALRWFRDFGRLAREE